MSCKANFETITWDHRQQIHQDLQIKLENSKYAAGAPAKYIYPYEILGDSIFLPFAYAYQELKLPRPRRENFPKMDTPFEGKLRPEQKLLRKEALSCLSKKGSVIISAYTGFGKSIGAVELSCSIGFKTLIIVNKLVLMKQWEASVLQFCPSARVQRVTAKSLLEDADFYIINAINVCKLNRSFFAEVGTLVVDEAHLIMAETLSKSLQHVYPRYLIGLTATPYRPDGLDVLLELYFGKTKIIRKLHREHTVYKVETGFTPTVELTQQGRVNWGVILDSQAHDIRRNEIILDIIREFPERTFMVLTKRVAQGDYLLQKLLDRGESVTSLLGTQQEFDVHARVLIGTNSKIGVGFDHPSLDALILASDVEEYFIQYLGRVFRTKEVEPIIFDLVDENKILAKHYSTRRKIYTDHGGTVRTYLP